MTGEDTLARQVAEHMYANEGTGRTWGIVIEEVRVGYTKLSMQLRKDMLNGHRTAHGGMIFSLADTAFAYACNSRNQNTVAASASIIFLTPAHEGETLIAEAREDAVAGRSGVYTVDVHTPDGRAIASFQGQSRTIAGTVIENIHEENDNG